MGTRNGDQNNTKIMLLCYLKGKSSFSISLAAVFSSVLMLCFLFCFVLFLSPPHRIVQGWYGGGRIVRCCSFVRN